MSDICEDDVDSNSDFVVEDEDTGSDDELQELISSHHAKFVQDQQARHERIRTSRPWSAPPLMSPRPDQQRTKLAEAAELKARPSAAEVLLHQTRTAYEPPQIRHGTDMANMPVSMSYLLPVRPQSAGHASWTQVPGCGGVPLQNILEDSPLDDPTPQGSHSHTSGSVSQQQKDTHDDSHEHLNDEITPPFEDSTSCIEDVSLPIDDELYNQVGKSVSQVPSRRTTECDNDQDNGNDNSASEVEEIPDDDEETESAASGVTESEGQQNNEEDGEESCNAEQQQELQSTCGSDDNSTPSNYATESSAVPAQSQQIVETPKQPYAEELVNTVETAAESTAVAAAAAAEHASVDAVQDSGNKAQLVASSIWQQALSVGQDDIACLQPESMSTKTTPVIRVPTSLTTVKEHTSEQQLRVQSRHTDVNDAASTDLHSNQSGSRSSAEEDCEAVSKRSTLTDYGVLLHPHTFAEQLLKHDLGVGVLDVPIKDSMVAQEHQGHQQGDDCSAARQLEYPCGEQQDQASVTASYATLQTSGGHVDASGLVTHCEYAGMVTNATMQQQQRSCRPPRPKSAGYNSGTAHRNQPQTQLLNGFDGSKRARKTQTLARETVRVIADSRRAIGRPMSAPSSRAANKPTHASFVAHGFESGYGPSRTSYSNMGQTDTKATGFGSGSLHRPRGHAQQAWLVSTKQQEVTPGTALASDDEAEVQDLLLDGNVEEEAPIIANTAAQGPSISLHATQRQTYTSSPAAKTGKTTRPSTAPCHGRRTAALPAGQDLPWWIDSPYLPASSTVAFRPGQLVGSTRTLDMQHGRRQAFQARKTRPASAHPLGRPATLLTAACEPAHFAYNSTATANHTSSCSSAAVEVGGTQVSVYVAEIMRKVAEANRWLNQLGLQHRYRLKKPTRNLEVQMYDSRWKSAPYTAIGQRYGVAALSADELMSLAPTTKKLSLSQFLAAHAKLCTQQPSHSICFHKNPTVLTMYAKQKEFQGVAGGKGQVAQVLQVEHVQQQLEAAMYACDAALSASPVVQEDC